MTDGDLERVRQAIAAQVEKGEAITVVEPPAGLSDHTREAVERAVRMMAAGQLDDARQLMADHGLEFTVNQVMSGKLEKIG